MKAYKEKNDHILLFSFQFPPMGGGISRLCGDIAMGLINEGEKVKVLTTQEYTTPFSELDILDISVERIIGNRPKRELRALQKLKNYSNLKYCLCGIWYPEAVLALLAGIKPLVILVHGKEALPHLSSFKRPLWKKLIKWTLESADLVICVSDFTKNLVLNAAPKANAVFVPNGVNHQKFCPGDRLRAKEKFSVTGKKVVSTVSRIFKYKGHTTVFEALKKMPEIERKEYVYMVGGNGPDLDYLKSQARTLGVYESIMWLGNILDEDLPDFYRATDIFPLCTRESYDSQSLEGFGLVLIEAQACGTPVIGTRSGGIPSVIEDGNGGWLIDQDDSVHLAEIFRKFFDNPDKIENLRKMARERVELNFSWPQVIKKFQKTIQDNKVPLE